MKFIPDKRLVSTTLATLHALMSILFFMPATGHSQEIDTQPPQINVEAITIGTRGENQVFKATVTDNIGVERTTLYYRFDDESLYESVQMELSATADVYSTTLSTSSNEPRVESIQYYVEAVDSAGNRTLHGFAFDPRERTLVGKSVTAAEAPNAGEETQVGMSTSRKIAYGVLGLVVVGALASSGGGSGSGAEPGVGVTVVVDQLQ